jgi:hypothetical protein
MTTSIAAVTTPLRQQYLEIKERYADAILLFRIGDFTKPSMTMHVSLRASWTSS